MKSMRNFVFTQGMRAALASVFIKLSVLVQAERETWGEEPGKASRKYACHMCEA